LQNPQQKAFKIPTEKRKKNEREKEKTRRRF
jgi:hypothetical protein